MMRNQSNISIGLWISSVGAFLAAVGNTPSIKLPDTISSKDLFLVGNGLQVLGSTIVVEASELWNLRVGRIIKIIGNATSLKGIFEPDEELSLLLNTKANLFQAVAGGISLDLNRNFKNPSVYNVGISLLIIGNSMHAIFNKLKLKNLEEGNRLVAVASWIKVVGAIITALSFI